MTVRIERDGKAPLEFQGWLLAETSTYLPHKQRWTELRVWAVDPDVTHVFWVVESVGRSTVEGETDRRNAIPCSTLSEVVDALSKEGQLTAPGRTVLEMAAAEDDELRYVPEMDTKREVEKL